MGFLHYSSPPCLVRVSAFISLATEHSGRLSKVKMEQQGLTAVACASVVKHHLVCSRHCHSSPWTPLWLLWRPPPAMTLSFFFSLLHLKALCFPHWFSFSSLHHPHDDLPQINLHHHNFESTQRQTDVYNVNISSMLSFIFSTVLLFLS